MQKPTLIVLLIAVLALVAGLLIVPDLLSEPEAPIKAWGVEDEVDGADPEEGELPDAASGTIERTAAEPLPASATIDNSDEPRVAAILRGRVINKFQQPVANAKVWLEFGRSNGRGGRDRGRGGRDRNRRIPEPVETDSEGRFAFQGETFRRLRVSLQVQHTQHAPGLFDKDLGDIADATVTAAANAAEVELGDLVLKTGGQVRGRVTDLAGNGVPHATITVEPDFRNRLRWQRNREQLMPTIETDGGGYYSYANVMEGDYAVTAKAKMHTTGRSDRFKVEEDQVVEVADIRLGPGYELTGYVRNAQGEPIADADVRVRVSRSQGSERGGRGERGGRERGGRGRGGPRGISRDTRTKTDDEGQFFVEHLPGDPLELQVSAEAYLDYEQDGIDPTVTQVINVAMDVGLKITGVVQRTDGSLVKEFAVRAYRLRDLPEPGSPDIKIEDLVAKLSAGDLSEDESRKIRDQMRKLGESARRGGRGGNPFDGGRGGRGGGGGLGDAQPHPDGTFVEDGLQEGVYQVHVQAPEFARYKSDDLFVRLGGPAPMVKVVVDPGLYCAGVVVDRYGDPIAGAEVEMRAEEPENEAAPPSNQNGGGRNRGRDFARMASQFMRRMGGRSQRLEATTDEDGVFIIKHVERGTYRLTADADGFAEAKTEVFSLQADTTDFELQLEPLGSIVGTVAGLGPEDIGEARVGAVLLPSGGGMPDMGSMFRGGRGGRGGRSYRTAEVLPDGSYRLDDLTPGEYVVRSWVGSQQQLMRELAPKFMDGTLQPDAAVQGGQETRFDMQLTRPQVGTVVGSVLHNGVSANGFRVELRVKEDNPPQNNSGGGGPGGWMNRMRNFGRTFNGTVDQSGQFSIKNVVAGIYTLRIRQGRRGGTLLEDTVQVHADATVERSYVVQTASLKGTLICNDGSDATALRGMAALLKDQTEIPEGNFGQLMRQSGNSVSRLNDGKFSFDAVQPGSYLLVLSPQQRERTSQIVNISSDQTIEAVVGALKPETAGAGGGK